MLPSPFSAIHHRLKAPKSPAHPQAESVHDKHGGSPLSNVPKHASGASWALSATVKKILRDPPPQTTSCRPSVSTVFCYYHTENAFTLPEENDEISKKTDRPVPAYPLAEAPSTP
jgi:hypothetical protein